jgi:membrane-associated HD superfamily phosphohydrolase
LKYFHLTVPDPYASGITWAFIGGFLGGPSALLLLPFLEISWHTASTFKLNRYIDLQTPLMVDLLTKPPELSTHTDGRLSRPSGWDRLWVQFHPAENWCYYHDVGKLLKPKFFVGKPVRRKEFP